MSSSYRQIRWAVVAATAVLIATVALSSATLQAKPAVEVPLRQTVPPSDDPPAVPEPQDPDGEKSLKAEEKARPTDSDEQEGITLERQFFAGGPRNVVKMKNRVDGRLRMRGNVQLNQIAGEWVVPINLAYAESSCVDCHTFAVALQIDLARQAPQVLVPRNFARAFNAECAGCVTVARALQYVFLVEDPSYVPPRVEQLLQELDRELREIHRDSHSLTAAQAYARVSSVIDRFDDLKGSLDDRVVEEAAQPSLTASAAATPTPTTAIPSTEPTPTPSP